MSIPPFSELKSPFLGLLTDNCGLNLNRLIGDRKSFTAFTTLPLYNFYQLGFHTHLIFKVNPSANVSIKLPEFLHNKLAFPDSTQNDRIGYFSLYVLNIRYIVNNPIIILFCK